jgi:N-acyl amino acid synthase of PEP-CTERM/exosortase system
VHKHPITEAGRTVNKTEPSLAEVFLDYFDIDLATSPRQLDAVARVRYRVYCQEFGYESAAAFPDMREHDAYDAHSHHCLITHRRSGLPAGCVRVICASEQRSLPIEDHCRQALYLRHHMLIAEDRDNVCEISRLAVDNAFRKRLGEHHTRLGEYNAMDCTHLERRTFSLIGIAALLSAFAVAEISGHNQIYAMMERNLARLIRRSGMDVHQAGDTTDYHGQRTPYFAEGDHVVAGVPDGLATLYQTLLQSLRADMIDEKAISAA